MDIIIKCKINKFIIINIIIKIKKSQENRFYKLKNFVFLIRLKKIKK